MPEAEYGTGAWQLYDMSRDQGEVNDLALSHPEVLEDLLVKFEKWKGETGAVFGVPVDYASGRKPVSEDAWTRNGVDNMHSYWTHWQGIPLRIGKLG